MKLQEGDIVRLVAPASSCSDGELSQAIKNFEALGFKTKKSPQIFSRKKFLSNTDEYRAKDLHDSFMDENAKMVWAVRGGYGSLRLLPLLDKMKKPNCKTPFMGLSDLSLLLQFLNKKWQIPVIHGPVFSRLSLASYPKKEWRAIEKLLFEGEALEFGGLKSYSEMPASKIHGKITGGNLTTLVSSLGSSFSPKFKNKIVILEDIGERGYQVDRSLYSLLLGSDLKLAKALVFGDFTGGLEADGKSLSPKVLKEFAAHLGLPTFYGLKTGHGDIQFPIVFHKNATLEMDGKKARLHCPKV